VSGVYGPGGAAVLLFVVPNGGGAPTPALANVIVTALRPKKMAGKRIQVMTPLYVELVVDVVVYAKDTAPALQLEQVVRERLKAEFALTSGTVDFGRTYSLQGDAYELLDPKVVDGVSRVFFNKFTVSAYASVHVNATPTGNGTVEEVVTSSAVKRREWFIQVTSNAPVPTFTVYQRRLGTITELTEQVVFDDEATYEANELVGLELHVREREQLTTITVTANTTQAITVAGGLLALAQPGDTYAVEFTEAVTGKVLHTTVDVTSAAGSVTLNVASEASWAANDYVLVRNGGNVHVNRVASVSAGQLTLVDVLPLTFPVGSTVDAYWKSADGTVGFAVVQGTTAFVVGDAMFVDTYASTADITLRPEAILSGLTDATLTTRVVGGVK
jgi:hypothetical protein